VWTSIVSQNNMPKKVSIPYSNEAPVRIGIIDNFYKTNKYTSIPPIFHLAEESFHWMNFVNGFHVFFTSSHSCFFPPRSSSLNMPLISLPQDGRYYPVAFLGRKPSLPFSSLPFPSQMKMDVFARSDRDKLV
jgi:hypothetical protein